MRTHLRELRQILPMVWGLILLLLGAGSSLLSAADIPPPGALGSTTQTSSPVPPPAPITTTATTTLSPEPDSLEYEQDMEEARAELMPPSPTSKGVRQFHQVLDELLAEFGVDLKQGQLANLKNLSIRAIDVSDTLPNSYRTYMQLLISERIRENTGLKVITCTACFAKNSKITDGKLVITSPANSTGELKTIADKLGIEYFLDGVLIYHSTHMVLGLQIFKSETNELVWARTYNSETIRSKFQKLAIDYSQVEKGRKSDEYNPEFRLQFGIGGGIVPNLSGNTDDNQMIMILTRGSEKFDRRRSEFGLLLNTYVALNNVLPTYQAASPTDTGADTTTTEETPTTLKAFPAGIALYGMYANNFIGPVESFNDIRHGLGLGLGVFAALGYIAPTTKVSWDMYFGKRFSFNFGTAYILPSQVLLGSDFVKTSGGLSYDVALSINY